VCVGRADVISDRDGREYGPEMSELALLIRIGRGAQDAFEDFLGIGAATVTEHIKETVVTRTIASREFVYDIVFDDAERCANPLLLPVHE
jgi:hypothetical protein